MRSNCTFTTRRLLHSTVDQIDCGYVNDLPETDLSKADQ
jgi:hypothetical protein